MDKSKYQALASISLILFCVVVGGANIYIWGVTTQSIKAKLEKYGQLGSLKTHWTVSARPMELIPGTPVTASKVSNYLETKLQYKNQSSKTKNAKCSPEKLTRPKVYCQDTEFMYIVSGRSKLYPSLKLQFDAKGKMLRHISTIDGTALDSALLESPMIYSVEPGLEVEKAKLDTPGSKADGRPENEETQNDKVWIKMSQQTFLPVQIGHEIEIDDKFVRLLLWLEDREYFDHNGISYRGMVRAIKENTFGRSGQPRQGSSTISSQVCKQLFSRGRSRNLWIKIEEFYCATALESHLTSVLGSKESAKSRILELYLNLVPLSIEGPDQEESHRIAEEVIGFGTASKLHIGKKLEDLNIAEGAALLLSIPSPARILGQASRSERRDRILAGFSDVYPQYRDEVKRVKGLPVQFKFFTDEDLKTDDAPAMLTKKRLTEEGVFTVDNVHKTINVETTIDWQMQEVLAKSFENELKNFKKTVSKAVGSKNLFEVQADLLIVNSKNGEILNFLSLKSNSDGTMPNFRSLEDPIKPGSSIKPFWVALMIQNKSWTMNSMITPSECRAKDGWQPEEAMDHTTPDSVQNLFLRSNNPFMNCACREISPEIGLTKLNQLFQRTDKMQRRIKNEIARSNNEHKCRMFWGLSSDTLVSIFDLASAYTVFPTGVRKSLVLFRRINIDGDDLNVPVSQQETVFTADSAAVVANTLQIAAEQKLGTKFKGSLMAKTGSTTYSYVFVVASSNTVFLTHMKIIPAKKDFEKEKVDGIFAGSVTVPLMKSSLEKINKERPKWIEGSFKHEKVRTLWIKDGCVTNGQTGEPTSYLAGTEPLPCKEQGSLDQSDDEMEE